MEKESNEVTNKIGKGIARVTVKRVTDRNNVLTTNNMTLIAIIIENTSKENITDVRIKLNKSDNSDITKIYDESNNYYENFNDININKIEANSYEILYANVTLKKDINIPKSEVKISANVM